MKSQPTASSIVLDLLRTSARVGSDNVRAPWPPPLDGYDCHTIEPVIWRDVVALASAHLVLPAIADPLESLARGGRCPAGLAAFCNQIASANQERNRLLRTALVDVSRVLNGLGVVPVALKGAAFLVEGQPRPHGTGETCGPRHGAPAWLEAGLPVHRRPEPTWRFMQDLDLLVPSEHLMDCVAALTALGYAPAEADYDARNEAHYPPMLSACGRFSIELHTRLFARADFGLPAAGVVSSSVPLTVDGARLALPSDSHRLLHALIHAQLHNRFHVTHRIVLKDLLDLSRLADRGDGAPEACVETHAEATNDEAVCNALLSLLAAWRIWRGEASTAKIDAWSATWARCALGRLERPSWRERLALPGDMVLLEWHRLRREPGHLRRRARLIASPSRLRRAAAGLIFKQRQRLWS